MGTMGGIKTTGTVGVYGTVNSRFVSINTLGFYIGNNATQSFSDSLSMSDIPLLGVEESLSDVLSTSDAFLLEIEESLSDVLYILDSIAAKPTLPVADAMSITESYSDSGSGSKGDTIAAVLYDPDAYEDPWMPYVAIGSSNATAGARLFSALGSELYRKQADIYVIENSYFITVTFGQDEPTEDDLEIYEIGLFDASSGGNMYKRWVLDTPITKDNIDEIVIELSVTIKQG